MERYASFSLSPLFDDCVECSPCAAESVSEFVKEFPLTDAQTDGHEIQAPTKRVHRYTNISRKSVASTCLRHARPNVPIRQYEHEILAAIAHNNITFVSGPTGSGKTTQVPLFLLLECAKQGRTCLIYCTQPRRLAVLTVAQYVANSIGECPGGTVGYAIHLDTKISSDTRLVFCTPAVLTNILASSTQRNEISHIILDEVHEQELHTDCLLTMLKLTRRSHPNLKLVLMSATMMSIEQQLTDYFASCATIKSVPVIVDGYPIRTLYVDAIEYILDTTDAFVQRTVDTMAVKENLSGTVSFMEHGINYYLLTRLLKWLVDADIFGAILVFLPGMDQITTTIRTFETSDWTTATEVAFNILHSSTDMDAQLRALECTESGIRKIILATNIAETSITIADIVFVVDCGFMKEHVFDTCMRSSRLDMTYIAKSNAEQRRGRVGRCQRGYCFRMYLESEYGALGNLSTPEITITDLHSTCLTVHEFVPVGITAAEFIASAPTPPDHRRVMETLQYLECIGALRTLPRGISTRSTSETCLTLLGDWMVGLSLDAQLAKMVVYGLAFQCVVPIVIIVAAMTHGNLFTNQSAEVEYIEDIQATLAAGVFSDHFVLLQLLYGFFTTDDRETYCKTHGTTVSKLTSVTKVAMGICKELFAISRQLDVTQDWCNTNSTRWESIKAVIVAGCYPHIGQYQSAKIVLTETCSAEMSNHCVGYIQQKTDDSAHPALVVYGETVEIPGHVLINQVTGVSADVVVMFGHGGTMEAEFRKDLFGKLQCLAASDQHHSLRIGRCTFRGNYPNMKGLLMLRLLITNYVGAFIQNPDIHTSPKAMKFHVLVQNVLSECEMDAVVANERLKGPNVRSAMRVLNTWNLTDVPTRRQPPRIQRLRNNSRTNSADVLARLKAPVYTHFC